MIPGAFIYRTPEEIEGLYEHFLRGLFLVKGLPLLFQLLALSSIVIAAYFGVRGRTKLSIFFSIVTFTSIAVLLHQPWDELFVNLTHAKNLAEHGSFSFHSATPTEGTVDTLPYLVLGLLKKMGLPLVEMSLLFSLIGGFACIYFASASIVAFGSLTQATWPVFFLSLYSPLLFNASHGFTTTLFAATVLGALYGIDLKKTHCGWWLLSLVPVMRTEGLWFVFLILGREFLIKKERGSLKFLVLIPAVLTVVWRIQNSAF